jgi:hypothetical protein
LRRLFEREEELFEAVERELLKRSSIDERSAVRSMFELARQADKS